MRDVQNAFHIAIPCNDLDVAQGFYNGLLGCKLARRYDDRITLDFFGDQLVCHLSADAPIVEPQLYPRHFGITFRNLEEFEQLYRLAKERNIPFFRDLAKRFQGLAERHQYFVLRDPSGNLLEFKHYEDARLMY